MKPAVVGINGKVPNLKVKSPASEDLDLALWHEKMSGKVENHSRKYALTAEKLRELDHLRKYVRHFDSCMAERIDNDVDQCSCGLTS